MILGFIIIIICFITGGLFGFIYGLIHAYFIFWRFTFPLTEFTVISLIFGFDNVFKFAIITLTLAVLLGLALIIFIVKSGNSNNNN